MKKSYIKPESIVIESELESIICGSAGSQHGMAGSGATTIINDVINDGKGTESPVTNGSGEVETSAKHSVFGWD